MHPLKTLYALTNLLSKISTNIGYSSIPEEVLKFLLKAKDTKDWLAPESKRTKAGTYRKVPDFTYNYKHR